MAMGAPAVLVKGGHLEGSTLLDLLIESDQVTEITSERLQTRNLHGTGCTLSSAIACFLAQGYSLRQAVRGGHDYVRHAIEAAKTMSLGQGHGPVNHAFSPLPMHTTGDSHGR
jgi:hydroxymethylpyrimidine/phosphomethylpyrimidine kinase